MKSLSSLSILNRVVSLSRALKAQIVQVASRRASGPESIASASGGNRHDLVVWEIDLPGVRSRDIKVRVRGNMLTIEAQRRPVREEKRMNCIWTETHAGSFMAAISLPASIDPDTVTASYIEGVLKIEAFRHPWARRRRIPVLAAGAGALEATA